MALVTRFVVLRLLRLHQYLIQNYIRIGVVSTVLAIGTGVIHWIIVHHSKFFVQLNENVQEFPFGVTFGILTVILISTLLLYALHLESVEKSHIRSRNAIRSRYVDFIILCLCTQMNDATERYLCQGVISRDKLDAMQAEIEDSIERFRESARKLLNAPASISLQELEDYFRLSQPGSDVGEEILKLKR
ncbi:AAEL002657-PA [Aedes aegypti]|nr:AAEL002657-PA [Aedes aegypti]